MRRPSSWERAQRLGILKGTCGGRFRRNRRGLAARTVDRLGPLRGGPSLSALRDCHESSTAHAAGHSSMHDVVWQAEPNLHTVQNRSGSFHGGPTRRGCRDSASKDFQRAPESSSSAGTARAVVGAAMDLSRRSRRSTTSVLTSSSRGHRWLAGAQQAIHPPLATLRYRRRRKLGRGVCTNAVLTAALPGGSWGSSVDRS